MLRQPLGRVSIVPKGAWDKTASYKRLDLVSSDGSSYIAKQDTSAPLTDTDSWMLVASRGDAMTFDDLTEAQLAELKAPATEAAADARAASESANAAASSANAASSSATTAAKKADAAADSATKAAGTATSAASAASTAAGSATTAAGSAAEASESATQAASSATGAAKKANDAAAEATAAKTAATDAAARAEKAATSAYAAATKATESAGAADKAAESATTAAGEAGKATEAANEAAEAATTAAARADAAAEAATQTTKLYGVRFEGSSSKGTRIYDAVGRTATPSTNTVAGSSDFDDIDPFHVDFVKRKPGADGVWRDVAVEGTPSWEAVGNLSQFCRFKNLWFTFAYDGSTDERVVSAAPFPGASPLVTNQDGSIPEFIYIPRYATSKDANGASQSVPGRYPAWGGYSAFAASDKLAGATCHSGCSWFEMWKLLLPVIEYADRNVQSSIGDGFSGGELNNANDVLVEAMENGNTVKVAPSRAALFVVGQGAFVGLDSWSAATSANIKADERTITAINAETGEVTLDGEPFSATTADKLSNLDWLTGSTDSVLGHTGQPVRSNKYPVKYRGVESIWGGGNEPIIDIRLKTVTADDGSKHYETYFCPDPIKARDCTANAPNADFIAVGLPWPTAAGYIKQAQASEAYPVIVVPAVATGASSTTYYCDYYYLDANMTDDRAPRSGNNWASGANIGAFCRSANYVASDSSRYYCARLFT